MLFVRAIIKIRGAIADQILLPWMKQVATIKDMDTYKVEHKKLVEGLVKMRDQPNLLFDNYKLMCNDLQPLLATLLVHNLKISSCFSLMEKGAVGLARLKAPVAAKQKTILTIEHKIKHELTEEEDVTTKPSRIEEPDDEHQVAQQKDVGSRATLTDVKMSAVKGDDIANIYQAMMNAVIARFNKMDATFFKKTLSNDPLYFETTTRSVERGFGNLKNLLKRNGRTRAIVLWAHGLLHGASDEDIAEAKKLTTNASHKRARELWDNNLSATKYDLYYFNKFMKLVREDYMRESKKRLDEELRKYLLGQGIMGAENPMVTKHFLWHYLEVKTLPPRDMPAKGASRSVVLQRCFKFFPEEIQKLILEDESEKKKLLQHMSSNNIEIINIFT